jgi:class 3 adenylate cyclase
VRAGVHTGEVELDGDRVGGATVAIATGIAAEAAAGEVLVSRTVSDLVAGSELEFAGRASRSGAGVPLLAAVAPEP